MAELLVSITGEVLHVAADGHQWGRSESREVYDAEASRLGRAPTQMTQEVTIARESRLAAAVRGRTMPTETYLRGRQIERDVPPPSRMGVVRIPGPAADYEHLIGQTIETDGLDLLARTETVESVKVRRGD